MKVTLIKGVHALIFDVLKKAILLKKCNGILIHNHIAKLHK